MLASTLLFAIGLGLDCFGAWLLIKHIFVTDEELEMLSELPLEPATTSLSGAPSGKNLSVIVSDLAKLNKYKKRHVE